MSLPSSTAILTKPFPHSTCCDTQDLTITASSDSVLEMRVLVLALCGVDEDCLPHKTMPSPRCSTMVPAPRRNRRVSVCSLPPPQDCAADVLTDMTTTKKLSSQQSVLTMSFLLAEVHRSRYISSAMLKPRRLTMRI